MNLYLVHTSVPLACYLAEEFSPASRVWQHRLLAVREQIEERSALQILDLHLEAPLEAAEPDRREVLNVAFEFGATVYDAVGHQAGQAGGSRALSLA